MPLLTLPGGMWVRPVHQWGTLNLFYNTQQIDAADEAVAFVWKQPSNKTLSSFGWMAGTVTTGATMDIRIETVDTTTGFPSGTLVGTNTKGTQVVASTDDNTWFQTSLTANASLLADNYYAAIVKQPNTSFGNLLVNRFDNVSPQFPYCLRNLGVSPTVSWVKTSNVSPVGVLGYDDGTYEIPSGWYAGKANNSTNVSSSTTPDTWGVLFQLPFSARLAGVEALIQDFTGKIQLVTSAYHQANATGILGTITIEDDAFSTDSSNAAAAFPFDTSSNSTVLAPNTPYRLLFEPSTTENFSNLDFAVYNQGIYNACALGGNFCLTTAKDPTGNGSFTNYNNSTDGFRVPFINLKFDAIDTPIGHGGFQALEAGFAA